MKFKFFLLLIFILPFQSCLNSHKPDNTETQETGKDQQQVQTQPITDSAAAALNAKDEKEKVDSILRAQSHRNLHKPRPSELPLAPAKEGHQRMPDTKEEQEMEREQQRITEKMIREQQLSSATSGKTDSLPVPQNSIAGNKIVGGHPAATKPQKVKQRKTRL